MHPLPTEVLSWWSANDPSQPSQDEQAPSLDFADFSLKRSCNFVAEKTCEMVCYLWFSSGPTSTSAPASAKQLAVTPAFVSFMQRLLETTQVSESVIVLSLHYIFKLKENHKITPGQAGSEFRIAVAAIMMANKFLDDNTYTNKTWSEVSGISMIEIGQMEREFLKGVDHRLYVDSHTYGTWLKLLKGLVSAKERANRAWFANARSAHVRKPAGAAVAHMPRYRQRTRSTSPPPPVSMHSNSRLKRPAVAAFSSSGLEREERPSKRPTNMNLIIPNAQYRSQPSPSDLKFSGMTLHAPSPIQPQLSSQSASHQALGAPYRADQARPVPSQLWFYALNGSLAPESDHEQAQRKSKLHYSKPPPELSQANGVSFYNSSIQHHAPGVQSMNASPRHSQHHYSRPTLPSFQDTVWHTPLTQLRPPPPLPPYQTPLPPLTVPAHPTTHYHSLNDEPSPAPYLPTPRPTPPFSQEPSSSPATAAPFNNAGPAGLRRMVYSHYPMHTPNNNRIVFP